MPFPTFTRAKLLALVAGALLLFPARGSLLLQPNDRLAIIGDPEAASGAGYAVYLEDYLVGTQQVPGLDVRQFGWLGWTADSSLRTIEPAVLPFKPTVATVCYGLAEGSDAKPWNEARADKYRQSLTGMIEALKQGGVRTIVLASPRCADPLTFRDHPELADVANQNLAKVTAIVQDVATKEGIVYADIFDPTLDAMKKSRAALGDKIPFVGDNASLTMAAVLLKALGCAGAVGSVTIDYGASTAQNATFTPTSWERHKFTVTCDRLVYSFPCHGTSMPLPAEFLKFTTFPQDLNRFILKVTNLPTPVLSLSIANRYHDYSAAELAQGVNLAADFDSPARGAEERVDRAVRLQQKAETVAGHALLQKKPDPNAEAQQETMMQAVRAAVAPVSFPISLQPVAGPIPQPPGPVNIIVDTDMDGDVDDVGALGLIDSFASEGKAKLLAVVTNTHDKDLSSGATAQAVNTYYGFPNVPIGAFHGKSHTVKGSYTLATHQQFCPNFPTDDKLPPGVEVYRKALAGAPDHSVVVASLGLLDNIKDLEDSPPDAISPLSGLDLIRQKVREAVIMANTQKTDGPILDAWPVTIVWTTYLGNVIGCGKGLQQAPENDPVRFAYFHFGPDATHNALINGRGGWDPTAAWLAVRGFGDVFDAIPNGKYEIFPNEKPYARWVEGPPSNQLLATFKMAPRDVSALFDAQLAKPPGK